MQHKWKNGRGRHSVCVTCGCQKDRGVYSIRYTTRDGKVSQVAPPCIVPNIDRDVLPVDEKSDVKIIKPATWPTTQEKD